MTAALKKPSIFINKKTFSKGLSIPGVNINKGINAFTSEDAYVYALRSFAADMPGLLEKAEESQNDSPVEYAVVLHRIKRYSSRIAADLLAEVAAELEKAAIDGDVRYILMNNPVLMETALVLISDIESAVYLYNF